MWALVWRVDKRQRRVRQKIQSHLNDEERGEESKSCAQNLKQKQTKK